MAKKYYGYTEREVLQHLTAEYERSKKFIHSKRELFRARLKDYTNITSDKDAIYVRLIYSVMQMMLAMHYNDQMTVEFVGRQLGTGEIAEHLQNLAEFDYEEMNFDEIMYQLEWDRLFFGKAILVYDHWNSTKQHPVYRRMNPMTWIPDMYPDPIAGARYHQFELEIDSAFITKANGFINERRVTRVIHEELEQDKQKYAEVRELTYQEPGQDGSYTVPVHYCYTVLNGEKFYIVTAVNHGVIIKMEKLEGVLLEEKKDPSIIKFPVVEFSLSPMEGDPFGVSVPDLIADKQRAQQLLLNLEKTKAVRQAWGGKFIVNTDKVNIRSLLRPKEGPEYIPVKGGFQDLNSLIVPVPHDQINGDIPMVANQLAQQAHSDIGMDERSMGIQGGRNITATENQRIQQNANLRQILNAKIKSRGLRDLWSDWYKRYRENFKFGSEKNILINSKFGTRPFTVKPKDIITGADIDIKIINKSEQEAKKENERVAYMAMLPMILNDPENSKISKTLARRKALRLNGSTTEEARVFVSPSAEEEQAIMDVELLNRNELPAPIQDLNEDHMTYIVIYQRALNTPSKRKAIEARRMAHVLSGQAKQKSLTAQVQQEGQGQAGGAINQLTNAAIQENKQVQATSLQDV